LIQRVIEAVPELQSTVPVPVTLTSRCVSYPEQVQVIEQLLGGVGC